MNEHYSLSMFQGWQTPKPIIDLAVELNTSKLPVVDLCGRSRYLPDDSWSLGFEEYGISIFLQSQRLFVDGNPSPVFANPPYGYMFPQCSIERYTGEKDLEGLTVALPGVTLTKDNDGGVHLVNDKRLHSCGTFSRWIIWLHSTYRIHSAFLVVPSSTDAHWHRRIFESGAFCIDTQRIPFEMTNDSGENYVPKSGNTKGTSLFWFPPCHGRKKSVSMLRNGLTEFPYSHTAKQELVSY